MPFNALCTLKSKLATIMVCSSRLDSQTHLLTRQRAVGYYWHLRGMVAGPDESEINCLKECVLQGFNVSLKLEAVW